jgi:threonine synthase
MLPERIRHVTGHRNQPGKERRVRLRSISTGETYPADEMRLADSSGGLLEVDLGPVTITRETLDARLGAIDHPLRSGVWRYRELMPPFPDDVIVSKPEGNTNLYYDQRLNDIAGTDVWFKHEGENPTGSFKDRGMTVGVSHARWVGAKVVACASTGNTSASVAAYAATAGLPAVVFVPEGKITIAKLAQTIAYGAKIVQVRGDFDDAMTMVRQATDRYGLYLLNSVNAFRLEGQKSIFLESLQQMKWQTPDWVVVPGGNLGNSSALGKIIRESLAAGLIDTMPRVAVVQAEGAAPLYAAYKTGFETYSPVQASTVADAIQVGNPVNYAKARNVVLETEGLVLTASDAEILEAKAAIDRVGIGCEPASATGLAGIRKLVSSGQIKPGERVLTYLTGNLMKDSNAIVSWHLGENAGPGANRPITIDATLESLDRMMADVL